MGQTDLSVLLAGNGWEVIFSLYWDTMIPTCNAIQWYLPAIQCNDTHLVLSVVNGHINLQLHIYIQWYPPAMQCDTMIYPPGIIGSHIIGTWRGDMVTIFFTNAIDTNPTCSIWKYNDLMRVAERSHWVWLVHQTSTVNDRPAVQVLRPSHTHWYKTNTKHTNI